MKNCQLTFWSTVEVLLDILFKVGILLEILLFYCIELLLRSYCRITEAITSELFKAIRWLRITVI